MDTMKIATADEVTETLVFEFTPSPEDTYSYENLLEAIGHAQREADNGKTEIYSPYLNLRIEIG